MYKKNGSKCDIVNWVMKMITFTHGILNMFHEYKVTHGTLVLLCLVQIGNEKKECSNLILENLNGWMLSLKYLQ